MMFLFVTCVGLIQSNVCALSAIKNDGFDVNKCNIFGITHGITCWWMLSLGGNLVLTIQIVVNEKGYDFFRRTIFHD